MDESDAILEKSRSKRPAPRSTETRAPWLPPLQFPSHFELPSTPEESSGDIICPPPALLQRSRTCATPSSSMYSRSRSASMSTLSRQPSTTSSLSNPFPNNKTRIAPSEGTRLLQKPPLATVPEKYRHLSHSLRDGGRPVRPGSRPPMPPADFWQYASKQHIRHTYISTSDSHRSQSILKRAGQREPSVCRYPILAAPAKPVCRTRRATIHSEKAHVKTASYESLRKGPLDSVYRMRSIVSSGQGETQRHGAVMKGSVGGRNTIAEPKRRLSRTLTKQRQPSRG